MIKQTIQMEHNMVKNPSWVFYKRRREFEDARDYREQIQLAVRAGLGPCGLCILIVQAFIVCYGV